MNQIILDDQSSWEFIREVLKNADWTDDEIDNIDDETLAEVVGVINKHLAEKADDPEAPLNKYNRLMELIWSYPAETKAMSDHLVNYASEGGLVSIGDLKNIFNAHELKFFKSVANIVGEEMAVEAFRYAYSVD